MTGQSKVISSELGGDQFNGPMMPLPGTSLRRGPDQSRTVVDNTPTMYWCSACFCKFTTWEGVKAHLEEHLISITDASEPNYRYDGQQDNRKQDCE